MRMKQKHIQGSYFIRKATKLIMPFTEEIY